MTPFPFLEIEVPIRYASGARYGRLTLHRAVGELAIWKKLDPADYDRASIVVDQPVSMPFGEIRVHATVPAADFVRDGLVRLRSLPVVVSR